MRSVLLACAAAALVHAQGQTCTGRRNQAPDILEITINGPDGSEKCSLTVTREELRSNVPSFPFDCSDASWSGVLDNDPGAGGNNRYFTTKPGYAPEKELFSSGFDGDFGFDFDC